MALVCLFCVNTLSFADADTLAPLVGNPQVYQIMRQVMEKRLGAHQDPIDEFIKQHANKAKNLSAIPHLGEEFISLINACNANNMLARIKTTLASTGGQIQVIFVKSEDELPIFEGKKVWGHTGTYVTAFALESEKGTQEGRRKIIGRLFHEIRARSKRAKELFDEEFVEQKPSTPEQIDAFIKSLQDRFENDNLEIQRNIEQGMPIENPLLAREFVDLTFAKHPDVMNRDFVMTKKKKQPPAAGLATGSDSTSADGVDPNKPFSKLPESVKQLTCFNTLTMSRIIKNPIDAQNDVFALFAPLILGMETLKEAVSTDVDPVISEHFTHVIEKLREAELKVAIVPPAEWASRSYDVLRKAWYSLHCGIEIFEGMVDSVSDDGGKFDRQYYQQMDRAMNIAATVLFRATPLFEGYPADNPTEELETRFKMLLVMLRAKNSGGVAELIPAVEEASTYYDRKDFVNMPQALGHAIEVAEVLFRDARNDSARRYALGAFIYELYNIALLCIVDRESLIEAAPAQKNDAPIADFEGRIVHKTPIELLFGTMDTNLPANRAASESIKTASTPQLPIVPDRSKLPAADTSPVTKTTTPQAPAALEVAKTKVSVVIVAPIEDSVVEELIALVLRDIQGRTSDSKKADFLLPILQSLADELYRRGAGYKIQMFPAGQGGMLILDKEDHREIIHLMHGVLTFASIEKPISPLSVTQIISFGPRQTAISTYESGKQTERVYQSRNYAFSFIMFSANDERDNKIHVLVDEEFFELCRKNSITLTNLPIGVEAVNPYSMAVLPFIPLLAGSTIPGISAVSDYVKVGIGFANSPHAVTLDGRHDSGIRFQIKVAIKAEKDEEFPKPVQLDIINPSSQEQLASVIADHLNLLNVTGFVATAKGAEIILTRNGKELLFDVRHPWCILAQDLVDILGPQGMAQVPLPENPKQLNAPKALAAAVAPQPTAADHAAGDAATPSQPIKEALAAFEKEWEASELDADQFLSALSPILELETVLDHNKPVFAFSEKVTFDNNLVKCLPKLVEKGVKVAVIVKTVRERALIDKLNDGKTEDKKILQADTIDGIRAAAAKAKVSAPRFYYFRIKDSVDPTFEGRNITMYELTPDMVKRIIDAIGTACRVEPEKLPLLHEIARKFAEAA